MGIKNQGFGIEWLSADDADGGVAWVGVDRFPAATGLARFPLRQRRTMR